MCEYAARIVCKRERRKKKLEKKPSVPFFFFFFGLGERDSFFGLGLATCRINKKVFLRKKNKTYFKKSESQNVDTPTQPHNLLISRGVNYVFVTLDYCIVHTIFRDFSLFRCLYVKLHPSTYIHTIHTSLYTPSILPKIPKPPFSPPLLSLALERGGRGVGGLGSSIITKKHRVLFFYFLSTIFFFFFFFSFPTSLFLKKILKIKISVSPHNPFPLPRSNSQSVFCGGRKEKESSLPPQALSIYIPFSIFILHIHIHIGEPIPPPIFFIKKLF